MTIRAIVELDKRRLDRIIRRMGGNAHTAVKNIAFGIERRAKEKAPVDTGALRASIYTTVGGEGGTMPNVGAEQVPLPVPGDDQTAYVGPSVTYGVWVEMGTRKNPAQPFLGPAATEVEIELSRLFGDDIRRIGTDE